MRDHLIASAVMTVIVGLTVPAVGQEARPARAQAPAAAAGRAPAPEAQPDTRTLMAADGGSLLQATQPPPDTGPSTDAAGTTKGPSYSLYAVPDSDPHVLKKHDLVNIVVREESKSATTGLSDQQRAVDFDAKVDAFVRFKAAAFSLYPTGGTNPEVKLEGKRDFQGTGEYDRTDTMTTRLEAEVIDVKPNGTLVIQARRHMKIDDEDISVTLTGVCRVQDVDATNAVLSTDMHDLNLQKTTTGQVHDTTKRGLLHQLLDLVNPF